ncbi:hypothetical protein SDJN03_17730, partial [Cucurbita argyrosperma subsp. sororia]
MVLLKVPSSNRRANLKFRVMRNSAPDRRGVFFQRSCGLLTLPARSVPRRKVARSPKSRYHFHTPFPLAENHDGDDDDDDCRAITLFFP